MVISVSFKHLYIPKAELGKDQMPEHQAATAGDVGCLFYLKSFKKQSENISSAGSTGSVVRM